MQRLDNRAKWLSVFIGLAFLIGYVAGGLLAGKESTWGGLLVTVLVAGGLAISSALLYRRPARTFIVAALCVAAGALAYMVFTGSGAWVLLIVIGLWGALAGVAISGCEERA